MTPEDIATLKVTRKDLVKVCAAALLAELETERVEAAEDIEMLRKRFDDQVRKDLVLGPKNIAIDTCIKFCEGRKERVELKVCCELIPGEDIPAHALVIVQDGTNYDHNFRVQFNVPIKGQLRQDAAHLLILQVDLAEKLARKTRVTDMDTKAREKLLNDALDSTDEGKKALLALKAMRADLKKTL